MEDTRAIIVNGWRGGTRRILSAASLLNFKMRRVRATLRRWKRNRPGLDLLINSNKYVVDYLNAVEERRPLSSIETVLRKFATVKADQLIQRQSAIWRRRAKLG